MKISILLADDHSLVRKGLRSLLDEQEEMVVVGEAADGRDAVRQAKILKPDVVIMDIAMPMLNGIEATQQVLEESPSSRVIILSIYSTSEHIFRALKAGAHGYLLKESAGTDVIDAVKAVHNGKRYLNEKVTERILYDYVHQRELADEESPLAKLTVREKQILQLVVEGKTSGQIARELFLSQKTVETYRSRFMQKLGVSDIPSLVKFAIQHGLTGLE